MMRSFAQRFAQGVECIGLTAILALLDRTQNLQIEPVFDFAAGPFDDHDIDKGAIAMELQPAGMDVTRKLAHHRVAIVTLRTQHSDGLEKPGKIDQLLPGAGDAGEPNEGPRWLDCQRMYVKLAQFHTLAFWLKSTARHV